MSKTCIHCNLEKPIASFRLQKKRGTRTNYCLDCERQRKRQYYLANREQTMTKVKEWAARNPEKVSAYRRISRARRLAREQQYTRDRLLAGYGMTTDSYAALLTEQGGVCAICRRPEVTDRSLPVDHCHVTGQVRGLLCTSCNLGLGRFADDPERLRAAAAYLELHLHFVVPQDPTCKGADQ